MSWKLKDLKGLSAPKDVKSCTVDEAVRELKEKYEVDVKVLTDIATDILVKYLTEKKVSLDEIRLKYSYVKNIDDIISDILRLAGK